VIATLFLVAFALVILVSIRRSNEKDKAVLRHTVEVNLRILKDELERKAPLVESLTGSDKTQADKLLSRCRAVIAEVEPRIPTASRAALGPILGQVFSAMNDSTRLHELLHKNSLIEGPEDLPLQ